MSYKNLELQISKESPDTYRARALDNGSLAVEQTFELRMSELNADEFAHMIV